MKRYDDIADADLLLVDQTCASFESAMRRAETVSIQSVLQTLPAHLHEFAFCELLATELEYRQQHGDVDTLESYRQRYQLREELVESVYREAVQEVPTARIVTDGTVHQSPGGARAANDDDTSPRTTTFRSDLPMDDNNDNADRLSPRRDVFCQAPRCRRCRR